MANKRYMRMRKKPSVGMLITSVVSLGIALLIGNNVLEVVGTIIGTITGTPFYSALSFLGMNDSGGTWASSSIVGLLGFVAVATFVLSFVRVSLRGNA